MRKMLFIILAIFLLIAFGITGCHKAEWHEIAVFNGTSDQRTEVFNIPEGSGGSEWTAYVEPLSEGFYFKCLLRKVGEEEEHISGLELEYKAGMTLTPQESGWRIKATGDLFFDIVAKDCDWQIIVESCY